jgi:hypothetical protein
VDDYGVIYNGPSTATLILAGLLVCLLVGWLAWWMSRQPPPPPAPPPAPPAPPPPAKAPAPPPGVSGMAEQWLTTMKTQIRAVSSSNRPFQTDRTLSDDALNAIVDPSIEHVVNLIRDYEARVQDYADRCRRMIEK